MSNSPIKPLCIADKHDILAEDVIADGYGEDYHYWSDVDEFRKSFFNAPPNMEKEG